MNWFRKHKKLLIGMEWFTLVIILGLAISNFYTALNPSVKTSPLLSNTIHFFWLGAGMSAINPLQIPFWFGWSTVLVTRKMLFPSEKLYLTYMSGIGMGTIIGHCIFIFGGRLLVEQLNAKQDIVHLAIGIIFLFTAIVQWLRMARHKDAISTMDQQAGS